MCINWKLLFLLQGGGDSWRDGGRGGGNMRGGGRGGGGGGRFNGSK